MLEVVVTVLAIVALFVPGLNIVAALLWIGFGLVAAALVGRIMLAATGNGSWLDVALDAFALVTFGLGKAASGALKAVAEGSEALGKTMVAGERSAMLAKGEAFLARSGTLFDDAAKAKILSQFSENVIPKFAPDVAEFEGKLPTLARIALKIGGASEDSENLKTLYRVFQRFAANSALASNLSTGQGLTGILGLNAAATFTAGVGAPLLGGMEIDGPGGDPVHIGPVPLSVHLPDNPLSRAFDKAEEGTTMEDGFSTAQIDALAQLASTIATPGIPAFSLATGTW